VTIWVSKGPAPIVLPDVRGFLYSEAVAKLKGAGFKVAPPAYVDSEEVKGLVISEDPLENSSQAPRTTITLSVSTGPQLESVHRDRPRSEKPKRARKRSFSS